MSTEMIPPTASPPRLARDGRALLLALVAGVAGFAGGTAFSARPASAPVVEPTGFTPDAWLAQVRALAATPRAFEPSAQEELTHALEDAALRDVALDRYVHEDDAHLRAVLRELLLGAHVPDLRARALQMATAAEADTRAAGFGLLARQEADAASHQAAGRAVLEEQDASALASALAALNLESKPTNRETARMLPRLVALTGHPDPLVRAHALQRLVEWDLENRFSSTAVRDGLTSPDAIVRKAAVGAALIGGLRDVMLKEGLLQLLASGDEEPVTRGAAMQALERVALSDEEHDRYLKGRASLLAADLGR